MVPPQPSPCPLHSQTIRGVYPPRPITTTYSRWDKLRRPAQFLAVARSTLILHAFGTALMLLAAFIVTISAWTAKGCKNADNDPHADLGDDFKNGLKQWCTTKKASAIFEW